MKIIQCNIQDRKYPDSLLSYLAEQSPDIIMMQEVWSGIFASNDTGIDYLQRLVAQGGYQMVFAPVASIEWTDDMRGNAILSKYKVVDRSINYLPLFGSEIFKPYDHFWFDRDASDIVMRRKRRAIWQQMPFPLLSIVLQTSADEYIRVMTAHFPASDKCIETDLHNRCAEFVLQKLTSSKTLATVFAGDLNIQKTSNCIKLLAKSMDHINIEHFTTLNPTVHPGFKNDIPSEGYMVDHMFVRGLQIDSRKIDPVNISDHYPLVVGLQISK